MAMEIKIQMWCFLGPANDFTILFLGELAINGTDSRSLSYRGLARGGFARVVR